MQNFTLQSVSDAFDPKVNCKEQKQRISQDIYPLQLEHLDYLTNETTEGGKDVQVLIITDHFTRYEQDLVTS